MKPGIFIIEKFYPMRAGMSVSRSAKLVPLNAVSRGNASVTWFSIGAGTSILPECYDTWVFYLGEAGEGVFRRPNADIMKFGKGDLLAVSSNTLCGVESRSGLLYTEIIMQREIIMNESIKSGEVLSLKELVSYEKDSLVNIDLVKNDAMKMALMAFDEGTGLQPHRAPGNAIVTALEGSAVIGYEGVDYEISEGESFRFEKNGLHSVTAKGRFKMSLILVLD